jgi:hypothetical protein
VPFGAGAGGAKFIREKKMDRSLQVRKYALRRRHGHGVCEDETRQHRDFPRVGFGSNRVFGTTEARYIVRFVSLGFCEVPTLR